MLLMERYKVCDPRAREATAGLLATLVRSKDGEYQ
jgi:hypothetical protein